LKSKISLQVPKDK
jgi:hypothetical protein